MESDRYFGTMDDPGIPRQQSMKRMADKLQRNTTMADVARLAGVGKMTVSRVLTGSAGVSKDTAERVYRAIKILHYQPNEVARISVTLLRSFH